MNVLIDARPLLDARPTGVSRYARQLCDALFSLPTSHTFYLLHNCAKDSVAARLPDWNLPHVTPVRTTLPSKLLHARIALTGKPTLDELAKKTTGKQMDLVISLNSHFTTTSSAVPHVLTVHDVSILIDHHLYSPKQRLWHKAIKLKKQIAEADHLLAVSQNTKQDVVALCDRKPEDVTVVSPGAPVERAPLRPANPEPTVLFLGTLEKRKNITGVVHAFTLLLKKIPSAKLILAGNPGYGWSEAQSLIKTYGIENSVTVLGYIDEQTKHHLLHSADVLFYPSHYEGFGIPVIEAMAAGTPVVTSIGSSLAEAGGTAALLTHPWRHDMMATALEQALTNQVLRETLHQNAQQHLDQFNWMTSARRLLTLIDSYAHRN